MMPPKNDTNFQGDTSIERSNMKEIGLLTTNPVAAVERRWKPLILRAWPRKDPILSQMELLCPEQCMDV